AAASPRPIQRLQPTHAQERGTPPGGGVPRCGGFASGSPRCYGQASLPTEHVTLLGGGLLHQVQASRLKHASVLKPPTRGPAPFAQQRSLSPHSHPQKPSSTPTRAASATSPG